MAQNTMEVGGPLSDFENNVQMKKHPNIRKHLKILEKYMQIRNSIKRSKHTFSMHLEISPFVPMGTVNIHETLQNNCA